MSEVLRRPYECLARRLVVAIDIGTTFTAASFCILKPGQVPKFDEILSWPKQAVADGKVPSVLYYDADGEVCAIGAETEDEEMILEAEDNGWKKAEWWKLRLRPEHLPTTPYSYKALSKFVRGAESLTELSSRSTPLPKFEPSHSQTPTSANCPWSDPIAIGSPH